MRFIKLLCLTAITAAVSIAIAGVPSAMAENSPTVLCATEAEPCEEEVSEVHATLSTGSLLTIHGVSPLIKVLCLSVLFQGEHLALRLLFNPSKHDLAQTHINTLTASSCGTNAAHTNCEVKSTEVPELLDVERLGFPTYRTHYSLLNGQMLVKCTIPLIGTIDCLFEEAGLQFEGESANEKEGSGHGMINLAEASLSKAEGSGFCSEEATITAGLLEPLVDIYINEE